MDELIRAKLCQMFGREITFVTLGGVRKGLVTSVSGSGEFSVQLEHLSRNTPFYLSRVVITSIDERQVEESSEGWSTSKKSLDELTTRGFQNLGMKS